MYGLTRLSGGKVVRLGSLLIYEIQVGRSIPLNRLMEFPDQGLENASAQVQSSAFGETSSFRSLDTGGLEKPDV